MIRRAGALVVAVVAGLGGLGSCARASADEPDVTLRVAGELTVQIGEAAALSVTVAPSSGRTVSADGPLRVREPFPASVADFRAARFAGRPVVGVHVRHGNGGVIGDHARWWINPGAAMLAISDTIRAAVDELRGRCEGPAVVFVATDSAEIEATLRQLVPGMITRAKAFRPAGAGELHRWAGSAGGLHAAMVEMLLLAEVDVLLRYPSGSYYSYWGATMGHGRHGRDR